MVHEGKRRQKKSRTRYSAYGRRRSLDVGRVLVSCVTKSSKAPRLELISLDASCEDPSSEWVLCCEDRGYNSMSATMICKGSRR